MNNNLNNQKPVEFFSAERIKIEIDGQQILWRDMKLEIDSRIGEHTIGKIKYIGSVNQLSLYDALIDRKGDKEIKKMKKVIIAIVLLVALSSCGNNSNNNTISEEKRKEIEMELSKINDNANKEEIEKLMVTAMMNYKTNPEISILYFQKLIKYKPEAGKFLADYYLEKKDNENYEKYQKIAAEAGIDDSIYNLAVFYSNIGKYEESVKWYRVYLEKHKEDKGVKQNLAITYGEWEKYDEAEKIFKELGYNEGNGKYYTAMYYKTRKNFDKAEKLYRELIAEGNPDGYFGMGQLYEFKYKGKWSKLKEIEEFYKKGAKMGEAKSAFTLGDKYFDFGYYHDSIKYFKIAAEKGDIDAMFNVGLAYYIEREYKPAIEWFEKAAANGSESAKKKLKEIEEKRKQGYVFE